MVTRQLAFLFSMGLVFGQYPNITSPAVSSTPSGSSSSLVTYSSSIQTIVAGTYYAPFGGGAALSSTEASVKNSIPVSASAVNLAVSLSAAPGAGNTLVVTLRDNGANATLTCEIDDTATTCSNNSNLDLLAAGDLISYSVVTTGTITVTPNVNINVGLTDISSPPVHPPIFLISHASAANGSSGAAYTSSGINTTNAAYLIVSILSAQPTIGTLTDSKANTWTPVSAVLCGSFSCNQVFYCLNPIVGTGHTFSVGAGGTASSMEVAAFGGGLQSFDVQAGAAGTGATAQAGLVTPSFAGSLIVTTATAQGGIASVLSVDSGFTVTDIVPDSSGVASSGMAYIIETGIVAKNPAWTLSAGGGGNSATNVVFQ